MTVGPVEQVLAELGHLIRQYEFAEVTVSWTTVDGHRVAEVLPPTVRMAKDPVRPEPTRGDPDEKPPAPKPAPRTDRTAREYWRRAAVDAVRTVFPRKENAS